MLRNSLKLIAILLSIPHPVIPLLSGLIFACMLLSTPLFAEDINIKLEAGYNEDGSFFVTTSSMEPGTLCYVVSFFDVSNTTDRNDQLMSLQGDGEIGKLTPFSKESPVVVGSYQAYVYRGRLDARVNQKFLYRLPFSQKDSLEAIPLKEIEKTLFKESSSINFNGYSFRCKQGDTIFAMRKGVVVKIENKYDMPRQTYALTNYNSLLVEHEDGSIASY